MDLSGDPAWRNARPAIRRLSEAEEAGLRERLTKIGLTPALMAAQRPV